MLRTIDETSSDKRAGLSRSAYMDVELLTAFEILEDERSVFNARVVRELVVC